MEIITIDSHLMIDGCHVVCITDGIGDKRRIVDTTGHVALVARQEQHVFEVQVTRFEHAHNLDTLDRFSVEGHTGRLNQLVHQSLQGVVVNGEVAALHQRLQSVQQRVATEQTLLKQRVVIVNAACYMLDDITHPFQQSRLLLQQLMYVVLFQLCHIGMTQYGIHIALTEIVALWVETQQTQFAEQGDKRCHRRLCQRISCSDIHLLHLIWNTMDHSR